jgi:hypothetical protein
MQNLCSWPTTPNHLLPKIISLHSSHGFDKSSSLRLAAPDLKVAAHILRLEQLFLGKKCFLGISSQSDAALPRGSVIVAISPSATV